ncbi:site-specific recombinase, partial [human gut metagenome]
TPAGKRKWAASTVESILKNEKYKGDALLQKAFTVDFLTKKQKKNEGEVPQYYVENSHPAIIDPAEWKLVQRELERRKAIGRSYSGKQHHFLPAGLRRLRRLLRLQGLAFHRQIPAHHLAVQQQVYRRGKVPDTAPDRGRDQGTVPGCLQYAGFGQRAVAG